MVLCLASQDGLPLLEDRPLGSKINFSTIHYAEGKNIPREIVVRGTLDGSGFLTLNGNSLMLSPDGRIIGTTQVYYSPIPIKIKSVGTADPDGKGRKVFDIIIENNKSKRTYSIALARTEAGRHDLIIREDGKVLGMYPMVDPERRNHQDLAPALAEAPQEEQQAIAELRKVIGYSFRFYVEGKKVTYLDFLEAEDIGRFDAALRSLKNLSELRFDRGRFGPGGLKNLRQMPALKVLRFHRSDIDDESLACLKDLTQLERLDFWNSRGITDKGVANLQDLKNLKMLDLGIESETLTGIEPKEPRITDAALKHLAGLTKLEYLNIQGQKITDEGLKHLSGMPDLQFLALSFSGITDKGLKHLEGNQKLHGLHLYATKVTSEGRAALKAKLPKLER